MIKKEFKIVNSQGIHMRPANEFAAEMGKYSCDVKVMCGGNEINGKSLMNMIAAGIRGGSTVEVVCDGSDEAEAMSAAERMITSGFGEK